MAENHWEGVAKETQGFFKQYKPSKLRPTFSRPLLKDDDGFFQIEIQEKLKAKQIRNEVPRAS